MTRTGRQYRAVSVLLLAAALTLPTGCSSKRMKSPNPDDPFEGLNREIYAFNTGADKFLVKPIAAVYHFILPEPLRQSVTNFFSNVDDITVAANKVLQLEIHDAVRVSMRFLMNTTVGVGGLVDVASHAGLYKQHGDFGLTLARWGMKHSPYIMVPFVGPTTLRDGVGFLVDFWLTPWPYIEPEWVAWATYGLATINLRSNLLDDEAYFNYAAMDGYALMRDVYLQRRNNLIAKQGNKNTGWEEEPNEWDDWSTEAKKEGYNAGEALENADESLPY